MLDTAYAIETPEGVNLQLSTAGPVVRFLAWALDTVIRIAGYVVIASVFSNLGDFGVSLILLSLFLIEWLYPVFFEVYWSGQTPGKRALGVRVLQDSGVPVGWAASLIRNLLRVVDFLPFAYGFGLVSMLVTQDFKRLGDLAAGTVVVYSDPPKEAIDLPDAQPAPPATSLRLEEQRAVVNFAERGPGLSEARAVELANIAQPLTGAAGEVAIMRLYQIANWLLGRR